MAKKTVSNSFTVNTVIDGEDAIVYLIEFSDKTFDYNPNTEKNVISVKGFVYRTEGEETTRVSISEQQLAMRFVKSDGTTRELSSGTDFGVQNGEFVTYSGNGESSAGEKTFVVEYKPDGQNIVAHNSISVTPQGEDGKSAPYYFQEWYAWSNDSSTQSVTASPTISGSWETSIPAQGAYAYLWRKSIRYVLNPSTKRYSEETAQYFRMSGTDGTSIKTKGTIKSAITASGTFPTLGFSNGDLGIKQGDSYMWQFNGSSWSQVSSASSDGDSYTMTKDCTVDLDGDGVSANIKGHLIQWSTEASKWIDLGVFQGQSGETWYTHVAWATNVTYSGSTVTAVEGFTEAKSPNDTTHLWMGVLVDQNSGQDPNNAAAYTWSYTKGVEGEDAVAYEIQTSVESVKIPSDETSVSKSITFRFYSKTGDADKQAFTTYYSIYYRSTNNSYTLVYPPTSYARSSYTYTFSNIGTSVGAIVVYIWGNTDYRAQFPEGQTYLAKKEVPILKDGDTGGIGQIGRFPYYCGDFDPSSESPRYSEHFVINSVQAPYFRYTNSNTGVKSYHVFNPTTDVVESPTMSEMWEECGGNINNAPWQPMTNDFDYLITKALFANFARLATFVMNGNLMFSLRGRWRSTDNKDGNDLINLPYYYLYEGNLRQQSENAPVYSFINENSPETYYSEIFKELSGIYDLDEVNIETGIELLAGTTYMFEKSSNSNCDIVLRYGSSEINAPFGTLFTVREDITLNLVAKRRNSSQNMGYTNVALYAYNFSPNIAINGLTGKVVMSNAVSRGTFEGNGEFENVRTGNIRVGGGTGTIVSFFENQEMVFSKANGTEISGTFSIDANGFFKFNAI